MNTGQHCQQCISCLESGHGSSLKHLKYHQHYRSNHTVRARCPINLYLSVCSERRSRGDRYDSMVSAVHAPMLLCVCSFPAVCRRCLRFIFQTRQLEFLFSECSMSTEADTVMPFSLCMHTDGGLLLPGNSCLLGYHRAAVVQRSTRRADELKRKPRQFPNRFPSGLGLKHIVLVRSRNTFDLVSVY